MRHPTADLLHMVDSTAFLILCVTAARDYRGELLRCAAHPLPGASGKPSLNLTHDACGGESDGARTSCRAETRMAAIPTRAVADAVVDIEELAAMAHQPVVVQ